MIETHLGTKFYSCYQVLTDSTVFYTSKVNGFREFTKKGGKQYYAHSPSNSSKSFPPPASTNMSTAPQPAKELTMRELAVQAATTAKLNSFASAHEANPAQAACVVAGLAKTNSPHIRMTNNVCDTNLVK